MRARAPLPKGSTSNHFRTRAALLSGVLDWILERELPEVGAVFAPTSADELVDALCGVLDHLTRVNRAVTTARLVLFLEASHDEQLRAAVSRGRALMEAAAVSMLARLGTAETDRPVYELLVRAALSPGQPQ